MVSGILTKDLTGRAASQLERKELARGAWAEGRADDALLILDQVLAEELTPRVAAECYVTKAAFLAEKQDYEKSLEWLSLAAPFIDAADANVKRAFYHQRGRVHKELGDLDSALTDYAGAVICSQVADDRKNEGAAVLNTANIYMRIGDLVTAREYLERAFSIFRQTGSFYLSQAYDTLANIDLADGRIEAALNAINQAFDLVGENECWRETFTETQAKIETRLLELLQIKRVEDLDRIKKVLVRNALIKTSGNLTHAGNLVGLTYKGVDYIVQQDSELQSLRSTRKPRLKSIIKKSI